MKPAAPLFLLAAVLLPAALFWWLKPAAPEASVAVPASPTVPAPAVEASVPVASVGLHARLRIEQGRLLGGAQTLSAAQGEPVVIELLSDRAGELHLHGYDLELAVRPGEPARLAFTPDKAGRFDLELHGHAGHVEIGALEVLPR